MQHRQIASFILSELLKASTMNEELLIFNVIFLLRLGMLKRKEEFNIKKRFHNGNIARV